MLRENLELLAPAGSFEILKAVIEAGADAVYVGGNRFGARAYANNFSEEELLEAIDYVHLRGRKLYLTINTLFKNEELQEGLYEYLLPFYQRGLDAVIVQDFGVIAYLKEHFPELPIHTSTQMTVTGAEGARFLKELGAERVVLARELSVEEMKEISVQSGVELEAFVHGALCYSYSGQCLFSSMLGGRSGNRGRCAQPCRLSYAVFNEKHKEIAEESYILSLKDLCGIQYLKKLREAGVYSLKIEGRMKQASYAAGVVSYYRKYIDLEAQVSKEDDRHLMELGNRHGFTTDYLDGKTGPQMMTFQKPSFERSNPALHEEIETTYVNVRSALPITGQLTLKKGRPAKFSVQFQGNKRSAAAEGTGMEVLEARNKPLSLVDVEERMRKTGETPFGFTSLEIFMDEDIFVPVGALNQLRREALEALQSRLLLPFRREEAPSAIADFTGSESKPSMEESSYGKSGRSSSGHVTSGQITSCHIASCQTEEQLDLCLTQPWVDMVYADAAIFGRKDFVEKLQDKVETAHAKGKAFGLKLPAIFRKRTSDFYASIVENLKKLPLDGIVIRTYEELSFVKREFQGLFVIADHNLYTYNDEAKKAFEEEGVSVTTVPLELNRREIRGLDLSRKEMVVYGHYPLMTTANCVHKNTVDCDQCMTTVYLKDRYRVEFPVHNICTECYNVIYNSLPTNLLRERKELEELGIHRQRIEFTIEDAKAVSNVFEQLEGRGVPTEATKGHYKRGVE